MAKSQAGRIIWTDLTVSNTEEVRDFYKAVVGWEACSALSPKPVTEKAP